ncbi:hypothetical protein AJ80_00921 [Polytolypa hystricis UAMH7299]|uniref:Metallo-beta-lactamase domain-containing protein n=1 Tax=Polytolypa hystricis (strain UAMH7299) TaxID=1447883 RepID=A0A2B7Z2J2_POLH7|nr:hypothetical protein AJ80_00921 [Polytolypa hystricis UAMH7299]
MQVDEGWILRGTTSSTLTNPTPESQRRDLVVISALIEHPTEGLILFETGAGEDYPEVWGPPVNDIFARVNYQEDHELDKAIAKTGHNIKDVKAVIMGHLHLDHSGGLKYFEGTDVPIYVHELELKNPFYAVATKSDIGNRYKLTITSTYLPHYLTLKLNWQAFHGSSLEFAPGLNLLHCPGHTPGLAILQINLRNSGTWIFTSDHYLVWENYEASQPCGWLARDHDDWIRSHQMVKALAKRTNANLLFGHCAKYRRSADEFVESPVIRRHSGCINLHQNLMTD